MLQFVVLGEQSETVGTVVCDRLPYIVGRSSSASLQLAGPGIWEEHARIDADPGSGKFFIQPIGEALLLINGESSRGKILLPNDEIHIGGLLLKVGLSPVSQKDLRLREWAIWALLLLVTGVEIALLLAA